MGSLKICSKCKTPKDPKDFANDKNRKSGKYAICKKCCNEYRKGPGRKSQKNANLKRLYGISLQEQEDLFATQGYRCAACGAVEPRGGSWHTDHCHETMKVCGIICCNCNVLCGQADDRFEVAFLCAAYLQRTRGDK